MMQDGPAIETATLGREAILGSLSALGNHTAGTRAIVQIDATAWRISVNDFRTAVSQSPVLRKMALLSSELMLAQMQQTAACNAPSYGRSAPVPLDRPSPGSHRR